MSSIAATVEPQPEPPPSERRSRLGLLLAVRARSVLNRLRIGLTESPLRVFATLVLIGAIWFGLYQLFNLVFHQFRRTPLEATVALPLVFNFFFVAMLALLTLSNALIAYTMLFGKGEPEYLLASPVDVLDVVSLKYLESLAFSSWSLFLLGLPLMAAIANNTNEPFFYPLFLAFFLAFIPIPGALGMLLAWAAARFLPRTGLRSAVVFAGAAVVVFVAWGVRMMRVGEVATEVWLRGFLDRMSFVEASLLPNNWVAKGIDHAIHHDRYTALCYLCVTVANAIFLGWLVVRVIAARFHRAFDRASAARGEAPRAAAAACGGLAGWAFFYLPQPLRLVAAKDLRTFFRDPQQWGQLVILFGLMVLYLTNMPTLQLHSAGTAWKLFIPFLNICAVSLILATFTCRFVFPLVSLEGHKMWLIALLPVPRGRLLLAKFAFAMTVTVAVAVGAMILASIKLEMDVAWSLLHLSVTVAICFGLCGFSVGIGARLPMLEQTNVARIANGIGGTTNLLASIALVTAMLAGVGYAGWQARNLPSSAPPTTETIITFGLIALGGIVAGFAALAIGARHFSRLEA